jgi:hypothetical protein
VPFNIEHTLTGWPPLLLGAVTRISVSQPRDAAHPDNRAISTTRCDEGGQRNDEVAMAWLATAAEPVTVRVELHDGAEHDEIGRGGSHSSTRLCMSHRQFGFSRPPGEVLTQPLD